MAEERWYLELSEETGSHKFYEVVLEDCQLSIRYGRIGDQGQRSQKTFDTALKARSEAEKKLKEKRRGGYNDAVLGERKKRSITSRVLGEASVSEVRAAKGTKLAPVLWKFKTKSMAFGISVTPSRIWMGNEAGQVFALSHSGTVEAEYQLPEGVKCIIEDGDFVYAGCNDGCVYDLNSKIPRAAYEIADDVDIYWLDIHDAMLAVSDDAGTLTLVDHNDEFVWTVASEGKYGWMVRIDATQVYHGHGAGVTAYNTSTGQKTWMHSSSPVLFGWQSESHVYSGLYNKTVEVMSKQTGQRVALANCDATVFSNAASDDGKYIFAGDSVSSMYCFAATGERIWKLSTGCGSALSMQYQQERLYIVTRDGTLACIDASVAAIESAKLGQLPQIINIKAPSNLVVSTPSTTLASTNDSSHGVLLECYKEGSKLRMRVVSPGYNANWNVQFPSNLREAGAKFVVEELRESSRGGFYRAYGEIRKLQN